MSPEATLTPTLSRERARGLTSSPPRRDAPGAHPAAHRASTPSSLWGEGWGEGLSPRTKRQANASHRI
jgi:hypothetical protein